MKIRVLKEDPSVETPQYATAGSAGADLRAYIPNNPEGIVLAPFKRVLISTGLRFAIEPGYGVEIIPRSGLALKHGITVLNSPGLIDADYRGVLGVIVLNLGETDFSIMPGDRIAQMVVRQVIVPDFSDVTILDETDRGAGGFGSTGKN